MTLRGRRDELLLLGGALAGALLAGALIARHHAALPFALAALALAVIAAVRAGRAAFVLLLGAVLFEIPLGDFGPVSGVLPLEVLVPLLAIGLAFGPGFRYAGPAERDRGVSMWRRPRPIHVAIAVFFAVLVANYLRSKYQIYTTASIGRPMFAFATGLGAYALAFVALASGRITFDWMFRLLYPVCVVMSILGLVVVVFGLPFNLGDLRYSVASFQNSDAVRVGFLEVYGAIGFALIAVGYGRYRVASGALFAAAMIASGGRSATIGLILGLLIFLVLGRRWTALGLTVVAALAVAVFAFPSLERESQVQRLTNVGGTAFQQDARSFFYQQSLTDFRTHPIFGTGVGSGEVAFDTNSELAQFHQDQLDFGGHATYHSLLKNFGLLGFLPFAVALLTALWKLGRAAWRDRVSGFFLIVLVTQAVVLYAAGNGSDPTYLFFLGAAAAAIATLRTRTPHPPG
jgi:O-antigen ligase